MLRLILSDLLLHRRLWVGYLLIAAATAAVGSVAAAQIETAVRTGGDVRPALFAISGTVIIFSTVTAVVVLGSITNLVVALQRRGHALWHLVGIRPGLIRLVVLAQLLIVGMLGGAAGCALAAPALPALFRFFFASVRDMAGVRPRFGLAAAGAVVLVVTFVVLLSGARGAGRASRVPALQSLREPDLPRRRMGVPRWLAAAVVPAALFSLISSLPGTPAAQLAMPLMLVAPLTAGFFAAVAPVLFPVVLRAWTALVPASASASWFLARNATGHTSSRSTATISPLMLAVALAGGFATATRIGGAAVRAESGQQVPDVATGVVALLIGGPLLLAVLGATITVFLSSRSREREFALIQAAGGTRGTVLAAAAGEALIYVVTAGLLGGATVLVTALAGLYSAAVWEFGTAAVAGIIAAGLLLTVAATALPALSALREEIPRTLAAE